MFENNLPNQQSYGITNQSFIGFIQAGKICNSYGQQIGVTTDEYNKAIETAKGFEKILYEKGILTKPKTPEEINQELQNTLKQTQTMMLEMSNTIVSLNEKVNKLEESKNVQQTDDDAGRAEDTRAKGGRNVRPTLRLGVPNSDNLPKSES